MEMFSLANLKYLIQNTFTTHFQPLIRQKYLNFAILACSNNDSVTPPDPSNCGSNPETEIIEAIATNYLWYAVSADMMSRYSG